MEDATFSTVTKGGQAVDGASSKGGNLQLGNRYAALENWPLLQGKEGVKPEHLQMLWTETYFSNVLDTTDIDRKGSDRVRAQNRLVG